MEFRDNCFNIKLIKLSCIFVIFLANLDSIFTSCFTLSQLLLTIARITLINSQLEQFTSWKYQHIYEYPIGLIGTCLEAFRCNTWWTVFVSICTTAFNSTNTWVGSKVCFVIYQYKFLLLFKVSWLLIRTLLILWLVVGIVVFSCIILYIC